LCIVVFIRTRNDIMDDRHDVLLYSFVFAVTLYLIDFIVRTSLAEWHKLNYRLLMSLKTPINHIDYIRTSIDIVPNFMIAMCNSQTAFCSHVNN